MIMTRKLKYETRRLHMGGVDIVLSNEVKLLGVVIDRKVIFSTHVASVYRTVAFTTNWHEQPRPAGILIPK
ncbi:unnamed protein product [Euphydryas editha]|uniref:Uncharacterized protein n=1 Tax=Euphydryas editha TaxID=104508 RepID=A0AAU9TVL5_EUPED|nr:unnamed protein product [Euphydryas editha]